MALTSSFPDKLTSLFEFFFKFQRSDWATDRYKRFLGQGMVFLMYICILYFVDGRRFTADHLLLYQQSWTNVSLTLGRGIFIISIYIYFWLTIYIYIWYINVITSIITTVHYYQYGFLDHIIVTYMYIYIYIIYIYIYYINRCWLKFLIMDMFAGCLFVAELPTAHSASWATKLVATCANSKSPAK